MHRAEKLHSSLAGLGLVCGQLPGKAGLVHWTLMCGWIGKAKETWKSQQPEGLYDEDVDGWLQMLVGGPARP